MIKNKFSYFGIGSDFWKLVWHGTIKHSFTLASFSHPLNSLRYVFHALLSHVETFSHLFILLLYVFPPPFIILLSVKHFISLCDDREQEAAKYCDCKIQTITITFQSSQTYSLFAVISLSVN